MSPRRELRLNAFEMGAPGHTWAGLWRHPRDAATRYNTLDYWVSLARTAERGLFDGVFLADVLGVSTTSMAAAPDTALARAAQAPSLDPFLVVPAMAQATTPSRIRGHRQPHLRAPLPLRPADHDPRPPHQCGRVGWNIVTGYLESGARGMGQPQGPRP